jgi:formylglycine-generating enzyme required for sulfatase activity
MLPDEVRYPSTNRVGVAMRCPMKSFRVLFVTILLFSGSANAAPPEATPEAAKDEKSGLEMVFVKGGTFTMGGHDDVDDGGPKGGADECPHVVTLRSFSIGKYEVTQSDWMAIMGSNPSHYQENTERPVEQVSWNDVQEFLRRLNAKLTAKYRLPTEEEWEFAARGGLESKGYRYSGSENPNDVAWYENNSGNTPHAVGSLKPNELGIYDMSGNIWEWCSDFKKAYPCDPMGKTFESRVLRGGTFANSADCVRTRDRNGRNPQMRLSTLGFRLAE